jgi:carbonic anhydrase
MKNETTKLMEKSYKKLLSNNKKWVVKQLNQNPNYFEDLAKGQSPEYLWIGCSDSRVPANEITGTKSGEIFVHRNIANMVVHTDMNMLSVLSYAVDVLKVKHVIVCGHYGCGGVLAAMGNKQLGLIDNWLRHLKDTYRIYHKELDSIEDEVQRSRRFVEVNVMEQVMDLGKTSIVQNAWKNNQNLHLHGWVYDIHDGIIKDLSVTITGVQDLHNVYHLD